MELETVLCIVTLLVAVLAGRLAQVIAGLTIARSAVVSSAFVDFAVVSPVIGVGCTETGW